MEINFAVLVFCSALFSVISFRVLPSFQRESHHPERHDFRQRVFSLLQTGQGTSPSCPA